MSKFLLLFLLFSLPAQAQLDNFMNMFKPSAPAKKQNSYKFIDAPKDKKTGDFRVNCILPSGLAVPELTNLQVKRVETNFSNYTFLTMNDKVIMAPIDFCFIIQN